MSREPWIIFLGAVAVAALTSGITITIKRLYPASGGNRHPSKGGTNR